MLCREEKTVCGDVKDTACGHDANQNSKGERERETWGNGLSFLFGKVGEMS